MYEFDAPKPRAARTKSRSFALNATPRTSRAGLAHPSAPIVTTTIRNAFSGLTSNGKKARIPNSKYNHGSAKHNSANRIAIESVHPPKYPDALPTTVPISNATAAASNPASSEICPP